MPETLAILVFALVVVMGIRAWLAVIKPETPHWEAVPIEGDEGLTGWKVQWSESNSLGSYTSAGQFYVECYPHPTLSQCEERAIDLAAHLNFMGKSPLAFSATDWDELE